jgi:pre-mRNA-splicing helicase BRR2
MTEIISILRFGELNTAQKKEELLTIIKIDENLFSKILNLSEHLKDFDINID